MKSNLKIAIFYILLIGVIIITSTALLQNIPAENVTYSDVIDLFENEKVKQFVVEDDDTITMLIRVVQSDGTESET